MPFLISCALAAAFGAAIQYTGTIHVMTLLGGWTTTLSVTSAPWLLLPFAAGSVHATRGRAALGGLAAIAAGFAGYFAMTLSPLEGVAPSAAAAGLLPLAASQGRWLTAALVSGPAFGVLGFRWRHGHRWSGALIVGALFCLEPLAWILSGRATGLTDPGPVWTGEVLVGVALTAVLLAFRRRVRAATPA